MCCQISADRRAELIGIAFHAWDVYRRAEPTEEQIEREIRKLQHQ